MSLFKWGGNGPLLDDLVRGILVTWLVITINMTSKVPSNWVFLWFLKHFGLAFQPSISKSRNKETIKRKRTKKKKKKKESQILALRLNY